MIDSKIGVSFWVIRLLVFLYEKITLPLYYLLQKPWKILNESKEIKARQIDPKDPYSPWKTVKPVEKHKNINLDQIKTLIELFEKLTLIYGKKHALGYRPILDETEKTTPTGRVFKKLVLDDYRWFTFNEVKERVYHLASGFLQIGIKPGDIVMIMSDTRIEWMLSALALFKINTTLSTIFASLGEEGIIHSINETEVTHIITSQDQLKKLSNVLFRTPMLRNIIYFEGFRKFQPSEVKFEQTDVKLISFGEVESVGKEKLLSEQSLIIQTTDTAIVMYTSGSTGIPKGVMISHQNFLCSLKAYMTVSSVFEEKDCVHVGYLPMAHVLEFTCQFFILSRGLAIGYGSPLTLTNKSIGIQEGCLGDLSLLKPKHFTAVPLVLDRIKKSILEEIDGENLFIKKLFDFAISYKRYWTRKGYQTPIINYLICRKIKSILGERVKFLIVGGAPLAPETQEFIENCMDVQILQGYGLTETTAVGTLVHVNKLGIGHQGLPLNLIKLVDWVDGNYRVTDRPYPRGEIVLGGKNITKGYFKNEKLTQASYFEENGIRWFYTGDIGEIHPDGTLKIVDRCKDLIKLQNGEYVSLGKIESVLKCSKYVDNICVIGDLFHNHLVALVTPDHKPMKNLAESLNKSRLSHQEMCNDLEITKQIFQDMFQYAQEHQLAKMEIPTCIFLCSEEWMPNSGLVGSTLKIKRKNIQEFYHKQIKNLYESEVFS